jgi:hypothetical protein
VRGGWSGEGALRFSRDVDQFNELAATQLEPHYTPIASQHIREPAPEVVERTLDISSSDRAHDYEALFKHIRPPTVILMVGGRHRWVNVGRGSRRRGGRRDGKRRRDSTSWSASQLCLKRICCLGVSVVNKVVEHKTRSLVTPIIIQGGAWGTISAPLRSRGTGAIPSWIEDAPVKGFALDIGPHRIASLLHMIIDVVFEWCVPEINPNMFVGVPQTDGRKYLHIASDMFKNHPCGSDTSMMDGVDSMSPYRWERHFS